MNYKFGILTVVLIMILGFIKIFIKVKKMQSDISQCEKYRGKLGEFTDRLSKNDFSYQTFEYLNSKSCIIQEIIGSFGIAANYKPAYSNYFISNYDIIVNEVNNLLNYHSNRYQKGISDSLIMIDSSLSKYIGYAQNKKDKLSKNLLNPFVWIREGIRAIVTFPIFFMYWTGIIEYSHYNKIQNNILFKVIGVIIGTLGFIETLMAIVTGYQPFMNIIKSII